MKLTIVHSNGTETTVETEPKLAKAARLFVSGFGKAALKQGNLTMAAAMGLWQGTKYKGDVKRGILTAVLVDGALAAIEGVNYVTQNWEEKGETHVEQAT